jgi:[ribosomal protein S5]-alanine N-acetyltransferase
MITEENFVDFKCPHCEETVSFPQSDAGFARACPNCTETVVVPDDGSELGRKLPLPLETQRLALRRFAPGDWKDLLEFMSDEEIFRYIGGGPMEEEDLLRWLDAEVNVKLTTPDQMFYLGIELKETNKLIGHVGLRFTDPFQTALLVVMNRAFQRKGYATEAVQAVLGFCLKAIKLHRVTARATTLNPAACKLFERVGMRREGEFLKDTPTLDGWQSSVWFAMLEEEFSARA